MSDVTKKCSKCKEVKPVTEFYKNRNNPDGLMRWCKSCRKKYEKTPIQRGKRLELKKQIYQRDKSKLRKESLERYHANPESQRLRLYISRYGLDIADWHSMFKKQRGCCAICGTHQSKLKQTLNVDHNHSTGIVRGLLCSNCNRGVGMFQDEADRLRKAAEYLDAIDGG